MSGVGWLGSRTGFPCKRHLLQDWLHPSTSDRPQFRRGHDRPPSLPQAQPCSPRRPSWGRTPLAHPGERPTLTEAQSLRERLLPPNSQRTHIQGIFVFWWCLFFKPTRSLGSAGKQDILREGRWLREQIPLQLWREAPGPCSREGGPAASSRLARPRQRPSVPVSPAAESCPRSDLRPHRPSQRFPNRAPGS